MLGIIGLIVLTLVLTSGFATFLAGVDIQDIKEHWDERRCELFIMTFAAWFKPPQDTRGGAEFAQDNFQFCTRQLAKDALSKGMAPLYQAFQLFYGVLEQCLQLFTVFRMYLRKAVGDFSNIIEQRFRHFAAVFDQFKYGYVKMMDAANQINAMIVASLYSGLSGIRFMLNMQNFVVKVVMIILSILVALVVLLWFVLLPFIPTVILPTIGVLTAAGLGAGIDAGAFCLHPETQVILLDGTTKAIRECKLGEILKPSFKTYLHPNEITGILKTSGKGVPLYNVDGVLLTGTHRVYVKGSWLLARDVPGAVQTEETSETLYILNTKHHWVATVGNKETQFVSDWEEVDHTLGRRAWIDFVWQTLNKTETRPTSYPVSIPLAGSGVSVFREDGRLVSIADIQIGEYILDGSLNPVKVLGIYQGQGHEIGQTNDWLSDGNWIRRKGVWHMHVSGVVELDSRIKKGYHLVTTSGDFMIIHNQTRYVIRDFTECGIDHLEECYEVLDQVL